MTTGISPRKLGSIQALRGLAAMLVVVMHCANVAAAYTSAEFELAVAKFFQSFGNFGVDIFFVISGFVIAGLAKKSESGVNFLLLRAVRILPLFWMSLAAMMIAPQIPSGDNSIAALVSRPLSLLLLQAPIVHPLAWTLVYEAQFYLVTAALILTGVNMRAGFVAWIASEAALVALSRFGMAPHLPITDPLTLEFCMGAALALFMIKARWPMALSLAAAMMVAVSGVFLDPQWIASATLARTALWGIPAALLVWSALSLDVSGIRFPNWSIFLGDISYSAYMWHLPIFIVFASLTDWSSLGRYGLVAFALVSLPVTLIVSTASLIFVERPIMQFASAVLARRATAESLPT